MHYNRIKDLREDADKTQAEVAEALFMHTTQYGRYERGERELPLDTAIAIAKLFNVSLDYIAGLSREKKYHAELSFEENELLMLFREMNDFGKGQLIERAKIIAKKC